MRSCTPVVREEKDFCATRRAGASAGTFLSYLETGAEGIDHTVAVSCGRDEQRRRALKREGMTPAKLDAILGRQLADEDRVARADFVVRDGLLRQGAGPGPGRRGRRRALGRAVLCRGGALPRRLLRSGQHALADVAANRGSEKRAAFLNSCARARRRRGVREAMIF